MKGQDTKYNYRNLLFLCTNNKWSEEEIKKTIPFAIASKSVKYLGINLTKEVKDLYSENCKTLKKEIEESTKKQKDTLCSYTGRIDILKMSLQSNNASSKYQWHSPQSWKN